ncbi:unnamed protein product [Mytilus coruscus]|uniref:WAP domain-containing protein n=1 Tax=Mytilus coruscus TaxID=42192 RepID=A0A6J8BFS2_MYTCO|nr:unnamed protein product [Mytilus coruscus]
MEGQAVVIFLGFISCVFAVYPVRKTCVSECSSRLDCQRGYQCQTVGCNRRCRPATLPIDHLSIDQVVSQDTFSMECVQRCRQQGRVGCRRLCQQTGDLPVDQIFQGDSLDRTFPGASVDRIRSDSLTGRILPIGPVVSSHHKGVKTYVFLGINATSTRIVSAEMDVMYVFAEVHIRSGTKNARLHSAILF